MGRDEGSEESVVAICRIQSRNPWTAGLRWAAVGIIMTHCTRALSCQSNNGTRRSWRNSSCNHFRKAYGHPQIIHGRVVQHAAQPEARRMR